MQEISVENILSQIAQLPLPERLRLKEIISQPEPSPSPKPPRDKRVPAQPMPANSGAAMRWLREHAREYKGQWVALDGDRLIAHGINHDEVWAAAEADGAHLPIMELVEDPDAPPFAGF